MTRMDNIVEREKDTSMDEVAHGAKSVLRGRALVVADDQPLGNVLAEMLREMGYSATMSPPAAAQGRVRALQPAFVVLAVVGSDALVVAVHQSLSADAWTVAIPVVAILPPPVRSPRLEGALGGAYLAMPFDLDDFARCIDHVHAGHSPHAAPAFPTGYPQPSSIQGSR